MERPKKTDDAVLSAADHWAAMLEKMVEAEQVGKSTAAEHEALRAAIVALFEAVRERQQRAADLNQLNAVSTLFKQ